MNKYLCTNLQNIDMNKSVKFSVCVADLWITVGKKNYLRKWPSKIGLVIEILGQNLIKCNKRNT